MTRVSIVPDGSRFKLVTFGSHMPLGPMALAALKLSGLKVTGLTRKQAQEAGDKLDAALEANEPKRKK